MKKIKQNKKKLTIGIIILITIVGFTIVQSVLVQQRQQDIVGTWVIDGEPGNKWIFTSNQCKWELDGVTLSTFTYTISSGFSPSGLEHTSLHLTNINNPNDVIEYGLSVGPTIMTLETPPPRTNYTHFTKE